MIFSSPGKITERITLLGRRESCVYLLDGRTEYAILGGGMAYIIPDVQTQIAKTGIDENLIRRLIIHHTHFDHVGIIPYFKKKWPWASVTASARGAGQLSRPAVIDAIKGINSMMLASMGLSDKAGELGLNYDTIPVEDTPTEGEERRIGDLTLQFMMVPGHSACSMAVYVQELKALFASDAGGIPFEGQVFAAANSNFDLYQASLDKMAGYDVDFHGAEHYGAFTGEDARSFIPKSIEAAIETRKMIEDSLKRTNSAELTSEEITGWLAANAGEYFLPRDVLKMVVDQMTGWLAKNMNIQS
jgi:glyoxylase-like metal-dependent hydrolase (beta-lactamase superfamily II)